MDSLCMDTPKAVLPHVLIVANRAAVFMITVIGNSSLQSFWARMYSLSFVSAISVVVIRNVYAILFLNR